jgi:cytochrome c-type biogenesis protein CcmF
VGPLLPWRRATPGQLRDRLALPASAGALTVVALALSGIRDLAAVAAFGLAAFVAVANAGDLVRGVRAFARAKGVGLRAGLPEAVRRNRRLYGGLVVHVGVAIAVVGITASSAFAKQTEIRLQRGEATRFAGYDLSYVGQRRLDQPQRTVLVADVAVSKEGRDLGRVTPSLNLYPSFGDPIGTPSIRYGVFRDLYASVLGFDAGGATFRFFLNPGVLWLWVGVVIMAIGGLMAAWPSRRTFMALPEAAEQRAMAEVG